MIDVKEDIMDREPVFVAGLGRTGKTLICSLLAAHSEIAMPLKESNMWMYFYRQYGDLSQRDNLERCLAAMISYKGVQILDPEPERIRDEFWRGEQTYARLFALFHAHYAKQSDKPRWGVQSTCVESYSDLIFAAYPTAKMIHMMRDPRDRYGADIVTRRPRGRRKAAIATAAWRYSAGLAKDNQKRYRDRYKIVRYETLVSQPEETLRDIYSFLGEDYASASSALKSAFHYRGSGISTAFIGRFRQTMSKREIVFMQSRTRKDMAAHNYELEPVRFSRVDNLLFNLIDQPIDLAVFAVWRIWKVLQLRIPAQMGSHPLPHLISSANGEK